LIERRAKIILQIEEVTSALQQIHNVQDGLKRLVDVYQSSGDHVQARATLLEIAEASTKMAELEKTKHTLSGIVRTMGDE
jgi:hypothetical protein